MPDAATMIPAAGGYRPRADTSGSARCPQCGLISLDFGHSRFVPRRCPRCLTGHLRPVELPELSQASHPLAAHTTTIMTGGD